MNSGIYQIRNLTNSKVYIGKSNNLKKRWRSHKNLLRLNAHPNCYLQYSWNKHGEGSFTFEIIEYCSLKKLAKRECYYVEFFDTTNRSKGYNLDRPTLIGRIPSQETCEKIRKAKIGIKMSEETKRRMSEAGKGRRFSQTHCRKIAEALIGLKLSEERKEKIRQSLLNQELSYAKQYAFVDPDGKVVTIINLKRFCKNNGLGYCNMRRVLTGERKHHKGWTKYHAN